MFLVPFSFRLKYKCDLFFFSIIAPSKVGCCLIVFRQVKGRSRLVPVLASRLGFQFWLSFGLPVLTHRFLTPVLIWKLVAASTATFESRFLTPDFRLMNEQLLNCVDFAPTIVYMI
ncbi:hypothetical protein Avbf_04936 [Armadillidium vulgare]|nr:hypothetical protein Avbf_04936 [Armadillidium vulgare]